MKKMIIKASLQIPHPKMTNQVETNILKEDQNEGSELLKIDSVSFKMMKELFKDKSNLEEP